VGFDFFVFLSGYTCKEPNKIFENKAENNAAQTFLVVNKNLITNSLNKKR